MKIVKKTTIKDVARVAGVSIATVSFVLNRRPGQVITERVRRRVWKAAEDLNYHPSAAAAGLARKRTHNLVIVFYRNDQIVSNQFYSFVIQGAIKEASRREYNLLFSYLANAYDGYGCLPQAIREKNAEGALFMNEVEPRLIRDIQARGVPVVAVDHHPQLADVHALEIDNVEGARRATEHLLGLGHRDIVCLAASLDRPSIAQRAAGFRDALQEHGLGFDPVAHLATAKALTFEGGYAKTRELLSRRRRPSAIFGVNDELAAGILRAAHELGLRVPRDLSVVGFDDITMSNYTDPPLTTVGVEKERLGSRATERLIELVENPDGPASREVVPVALVERRSTASPAGLERRSSRHALGTVGSGSG